jgi:hypothetical protein
MFELRQGRAFQKTIQRREKNNKKENNDYDYESKFFSQDDGGYAFVATLATHVG